MIITDMFTHTVATSVDVEHIFSRGRLILSHVRNHLLAQSTCTLLCVRSWSLMGLVKNDNIKAVATITDVEGDDQVMEDG